MTRLPDLSPEQIRLLAKLDDGFDHTDSVGREFGELRRAELPAARFLANAGLVSVSEGHRGQVSVRLTEKGRKVVEEGEA